MSAKRHVKHLSTSTCVHLSTTARLVWSARPLVLVLGTLLIVYGIAVHLSDSSIRWNPNYKCKQLPCTGPCSFGAAFDFSGGIMKFSIPRTKKHSIKLPSICSNLSCHSDFLRHLLTDAHLIPPLRHILWRNESVSTYFGEQLATWVKIHPNWTFVLWRDQDMQPFVAAHFPGLLSKFKSLPQHIMRVDLIRYLLLFKFGGVYADLDYKLVRSLDQFRHFPAVITREPDAHSLQFLGLSWPVRPLLNPAFMMSAPGHIFYSFAMLKLQTKAAHGTLYYAGPFGLTDILEDFAKIFPLANNAMETVYIPPSFSFYPYHKNRLKTSKSAYTGQRLSWLSKRCTELMSGNKTSEQQLKKSLKQFCSDVDNMDPITDKSQPVFAIHDQQKVGAFYDGVGAKLYIENTIDIKKVIPKIKFGKDFI